MPDRLGNLRQLTNNTGQVALAQSYDPFGNLLERTGSGQSIFGYTGEQMDPTGLVFLRARYYNPYLNQFISPDPIIPDYFNPQSLNRYSYAYNNPVNRTDPSGLFPPEVIERSVSPITLNILKNERTGLYQLLRSAGDGDTVDALRIHIKPFDNFGPPYRSLGGGYLVCKDGRIGVDHPGLPGGPSFSRESFDEFINRIEMEMRSDPHPDGATTRWAKVSDSHYYVRSVYLGGGEFHYYSDFAGQDSPLPDVVAVEGSVITVGGMVLIDKFGNGYISGEGGLAGLGPELNLRNFMDGYVDPPSQANTEKQLQDILLGYGISFEGELAGNGSGVSLPSPVNGRSVTWFTQGVPGFSFGLTASVTMGPFNWGIEGWNFLDPPVAGEPSDAVAVIPDNGCNCGK